MLHGTDDALRPLSAKPHVMLPSCVGTCICTTSADTEALQVRDVLAQLRKQWLGPDYDLLTNNCLHFCDSLAEGLQVPKIPGDMSNS